jgi:hypothetical protein
MRVDPVRTVLRKIKFISKFGIRSDRTIQSILEHRTFNKNDLILPLSNTDGTIHPNSTILEHTVSMKRSICIQLVMNIDYQSIITSGFNNR